jgi:predicted Zn-dependent protease
MSRRDFVRLSGLAAAGLLTGCAVNPVTGRRQLMLVSEAQEIDVDRKNAPYQLSTDYGVVRDAALADYLQRTGMGLAARSHRPGMPYRFKAVNATYINAYAFPGGTIAATRGILLRLEDEAELAALLGHELGHVNARHTASQMSKTLLTQTLVGGASAVAGIQSQAFGELAAQLGTLGAGALLASYSRDNEREADALGLAYMDRAGYNPAGFEGLMDMLRRLNKSRPSSIQLMFATHPMSEERYQTAVDAVAGEYGGREDRPLYRERYMDHTAGIRRIRGAIEAMEDGEKEMASENYAAAEARFAAALDQAPEDYAGLLMMAKCLIVQDRLEPAEVYTGRAKEVDPDEAQAQFLSGFVRLGRERYGAALEDFGRYDALLPGNPAILFLKGYCLEKTQRRPEAARHYYAFIEEVQQGDMARYAYGRLVQWGYLKP